MRSATAKLQGAISFRTTRPPAVEAGRAMAGLGLTVTVAGTAFLAHLNLASAMSLLMLLVVLVALRWGFRQATVVCVVAAGCLDYLFTEPIYQFTVGDAENWISLAIFETTALLVSRLSWKLRVHAEEQEVERQGIAKLYDLSNAILLVDGRSSTIEQLSALMREFFEVEAVEMWTAYDGGPGGVPPPSVAEQGAAYRTYLDGVNGDSAEERWSRRVLRLGTTPIGAMVLRGWEVDASLADAAASLIAVALERARSMQKENRAEAARNTEQLRTAVLDALAHGFKTPLTAIQTASSGLLAIGQLDTTQAELVSIIDQEAAMLARLTTRLLQTAALDAKEIRLRSSKVRLLPVVESIVAEQDEATRERVRVHEPEEVLPVLADAQLIKLALTQLIDNAAKYSGVGSTIDVTLTQDEAQTMVVVSNQGTPIPREDLGRIFERYYRGQFASRGPTGTGLGLSIVKKIAEAHDGRVWATCEGDRTRFWFSLMGGRGPGNGET